MKKTFTLLGLVVLGFSNIASAQTASAFGIDRGLSIQKLVSLGAVYNSKDKSYRLNNAPKSNNSFDYYVIKATEKHGVCAVTGIGTDIITNEYGDKVKSQFSALKSALNTKYGVSKDYDFLHSKSIWDGEKYWMRSLEQDERSLASFWDKDGGANIPNGLFGISLIAGALSSTKGFINVRYEFDNYQSCKAELEKANTNGL